jgi:hypothetical protein
MKRSQVIKLIAVGAGAAALYGTWEGRECRNERGETVACRSSGSSGHGGASSGGSSGSHSVSRGGFGAIGAGHGGGT